MHIRDLGELKGEVLLFGGVYSNAHAFESFLKLADALGVENGNMVHNGDIVAYCADPLRSVDLLRERLIPAIAGNCEVQLANGADHCGCGFDEGISCDLASGAWYAHAQKALDSAACAFLGGLPDRIIFESYGFQAAVIHGAASSINRFLWPNVDQRILHEEHRLLSEQVGSVDLVISGHSGLPFLRDCGDFLWVNTGSIGQPPNDGDPRTSFARLGPDGVKLERLEYDFEAAAAAMEAAGLVQGYETMLRSGWWPSEEMLPPEFRRQKS